MAKSKVSILSKKEFNKLHPGDSGVFTPSEIPGEPHLIELPKGASSRVRLHEIGHSRLPVWTDPSSERQIVDHELASEIFAWRVQGKTLNWKVALPAIYALDYREPHKAYDLIVAGLSRLGLQLKYRDSELLKEFLHSWRGRNTGIEKDDYWVLRAGTEGVYDFNYDK